MRRFLSDEETNAFFFFSTFGLEAHPSLFSLMNYTQTLLRDEIEQDPQTATSGWETRDPVREEEDEGPANAVGGSRKHPRGEEVANHAVQKEQVRED